MGLEAGLRAVDLWEALQPSSASWPLELQELLTAFPRAWKGKGPRPRKSKTKPSSSLSAPGLRPPGEAV